jgi:DNA-binding beta-propeller fold protein YncE
MIRTFFKTGLIKRLKIKGLVMATAVAAVLSLLSCAPSFKANIDHALAGSIVWPGPPEDPKIQYAWTLYSFVPEGENLADYIFGSERDSAAYLAFFPYMMRPYGLHVDSDKRMYIVDQGPPRVTVVGLENLDVRHFGFEGEGRLLMPIDVTLDDERRIYVTDSEAKNIKIYNQSGDFVGFFAGKAVFKRPTGITYERNSKSIFILDTAEHKVFVFDTRGNRRFSFGRRGSGDGEFNYPTHITSDRDGKIYITDAMNFRIQIFTNKGQFISQIGKQGDTYADLDRPKGIAVDTEGHVYIADMAQDMIKIFNQEGKLLLFFGDAGRIPGKFMMPAGIFIDDNNIIYVADTYNMRIQAFRYLGESRKG